MMKPMRQPVALKSFPSEPAVSVQAAMRSSRVATRAKGVWKLRFS